MVGEAATVEGAIAALRHFEGKLEMVHTVHLVDPSGVLTGVVPLARILLAAGDSPLKELAMDPLISVEAHTDQKSVIDLFHKYNLLTLPVVDEKSHLLGIVTADDILELVVSRK